MKRTAIIPILIVPLLFVSSASSQLNDWKAVQALPSGTKIKVQLERGSTFGHCFFDHATDTELACSVRGRILLVPIVRQHVYPRSNVKAVFRTHNGTLIGFGVGAGTGAAMGAARSGCCRGGNALLGAAAMGGVGTVVGTALDPFFHGKAVYRSQKNSSAAPRTPKNTPPNPEARDTTPPEPKIPCLRDGTTLQCVDE